MKPAVAVVLVSIALGIAPFHARAESALSARAIMEKNFFA